MKKMKAIQTFKYNTNFFERYARASLIDLVDESFIGLQNYDRPDLQDKDRGIGIEVTRAILENKDVANALMNEIVGKPVVEVFEDDRINSAKYDYRYGINEKIEFEYWAAALPLRRIIKNKVHKVAAGFYGDFSEYGLYIFSKEDLAYDMVSSTLSYIVELQKDYKKKYRFMYISQIQQLFVCDLENPSFKMIEITKEQCRKFYRVAIAE